MRLLENSSRTWWPIACSRWVFPEPGGAVDEQRVVRPGRALGDAQRGRVGEAVGRADDELVERVAGVQLRAGPGVGAARPPAAEARSTTSRRVRRPGARGPRRHRRGARCRPMSSIECGTPVSAWTASVEQAQVARADTFDGDGAGNAEQQRRRRCSRGRGPPGTRCSRSPRRAGPEPLPRPLPTGHLPLECPYRLPDCPQPFPHVWRSHRPDVRLGLLLGPAWGAVSKLRRRDHGEVPGRPGPTGLPGERHAIRSRPSVPTSRTRPLCPESRSRPGRPDGEGGLLTFAICP